MTVLAPGRGDDQRKHRVGTLRAVAGIDDDAGDDDPVGPRPAPSDRPWVHPAELQAFVAAPARTAEPPRPREWVIGLVSAGAGVLVTVLVLVAFGALGGRERSVVPPPVVTVPNSPIDYAVAQRVATSAGPSVVTVTTDQLGPDGKAVQGSGVILHTDRVVTSAHFVTGASKVEVSTKDGDTFTAQVIGVDPTTDLCLLLVAGVGPQLPEPQLRVVPGDRRPGDRGRRRAGQRGLDEHRCRPGGELDLVLRQRHGVGAGAGRDEHGDGPRDLGGALFDPDGRIIGILVSTPGGARQGLAVPIDVALDVTAQLERDKSAKHGAIGVVFGADVTGKVTGATVAAVVPDGPAAKADTPLEPGDVIVSAGNDPVHGWQDMVAEARRRQPTEQLELGRRPRASRTLHVRLQLDASRRQPWTRCYGPAG